MKIIVAVAGVLLLAACASPYEDALQSRNPVRPEAPYTKADLAAQGPYDASPHFKAK